MKNMKLKNRIAAGLMVFILAMTTCACTSGGKEAGSAETASDSQNGPAGAASSAETAGTGEPVSGTAGTSISDSDTAKNGESASETAGTSTPDSASGSDKDTTLVPEPTRPATPTPEPHACVGLTIPGKYNLSVPDAGGTIEEITYMAKDYLGDGPDVEKKAYVYLPYGYDESKKYNVLYLCHGIGGSEIEWGLNNKTTSRVKRILDNLFADGDAEPFIVVTPNGRALALSGITGNDLFYKFGYELRNDLIPYMESHYSTYAEYNEDGYDLTATRTHRAMAGLSMGGMQTINIGMCECLDLFSWFGAFSAAPTSYSAARVKTFVEQSEYKVDFFYNICGKQDDIAYSSAAAAAKSLPAISDLFVENENFLWQEKAGGHDFNIWYLGLYNFAQIAFGNKWVSETAGQ